MCDKEVRKFANMGTKQTYTWSTPFFDIEFIDIKTRKQRGELSKRQRERETLASSHANSVCNHDQGSQCFMMLEIQTGWTDRQALTHVYVCVGHMEVRPVLAKSRGRGLVLLLLQVEGCYLRLEKD